MNGKDHVMHEMTKKRLESLGSILKGMFFFWKKKLQIENNPKKVCKIIIHLHNNGGCF